MRRWIALVAFALPAPAAADDPLESMTGRDEWAARAELPERQRAMQIWEEASKRWERARTHFLRQRRRMQEIRRSLGLPEPEPPPPAMSDADRLQRIEDVLHGRRAMRSDELDDAGHAIDRESPLPERARSE
ncbi:MAG: hypothetical protein HYY06_09180 [Deltaproteobacteria bacterium]|nr:hypothetical protein [Deltaproteobacteria bacterium]